MKMSPTPTQRQVLKEGRLISEELQTNVARQTSAARRTSANPYRNSFNPAGAAIARRIQSRYALTRV
jgi:hypothetical protein